MTHPHYFKSPLNCSGKILSQYKRQQAIQHHLLVLIKSSLPTHLAEHVLYCVTTERKVVMYTDCANWSSQLRFYHSKILQKIATANQGYFEVLQIKIVPPTIERQVKSANIPSKKSIDFILKQAHNQPHKVLKTALLKLVNTLNKYYSDTDKPPT